MGGVDRRADTRLLGDRHDAVQEVREIVPQPLRIHVAVGGEQRLQLGGLVRGGPPRELPGAARQVDGSERSVVVRERGGPVWQAHGEVGARPVEDRHEVVTQHRDAELAHARDTGAIAIDEPIAPGAPQLDILVHRDALDDGKAESGVLDLSLEGAEVRPAAGVAHRHVVQRADHARDTGDLSDVRERDRVGGTEPAKTRDHVWSSASTSRTLARLKSPGTVSFNALAATANSSASAGGSPPTSLAMRAAAKLSPPPTRSTTSTQCRRLRAKESVVASYSTALQPCCRGPRISRRVSATRSTPKRSARRCASSRARSGVASDPSSASIASMARKAAVLPINSCACRTSGSTHGRGSRSRHSASP